MSETEIDDGGCVYPNQQTSAQRMLCKCGKIVNFPDVTHHGITLRDHLAKGAMQGQMAWWNESGDHWTFDKIVKTSYKIADAMIAEKRRTE